MNQSDKGHTLGPWQNDDGIIYPPDDCDGMIWIADCRAATNSEANAALIARAPDLLAENSKLKEQRDELVKALEMVPALRPLMLKQFGYVPDSVLNITNVARAVLAKLKEAGS